MISYWCHPGARPHGFVSVWFSFHFFRTVEPNFAWVKCTGRGKDGGQRTALDLADAGDVERRKTMLVVVKQLPWRVGWVPSWCIALQAFADGEQEGWSEGLGRGDDFCIQQDDS